MLSRLLELVRRVEPGVRVEWDARDAIKLYVPWVSRAWGQWWTKKAAGLEGRFLGKKGQFNLSQFEGIGVAQEVKFHNRTATLN